MGHVKLVCSSQLRLKIRYLKKKKSEICKYVGGRAQDLKLS